MVVTQPAPAGASAGSCQHGSAPPRSASDQLRLALAAAGLLALLGMVMASNARFADTYVSDQLRAAHHLQAGQRFD